MSVLLSVVQRYVPALCLSPETVVREFRCPWCHDPAGFDHSLSVYLDADLWCCSECGRSGDVISFVMQIEGIGVGPAIEMLREWYVSRVGDGA